jgi:hypothetical protein
MFFGPGGVGVSVGDEELRVGVSVGDEELCVGAAVAVTTLEREGDEIGLAVLTALAVTVDVGNGVFPWTSAAASVKTPPIMAPSRATRPAMIPTFISTGCELYRCFIPIRRPPPSGVLRAMGELYWDTAKGDRGSPLTSIPGRRCRSL